MSLGNKFGKVFESKDVIPAVYKALLDEALGSDWIYWELITIYDSIHHTFGVTPTEDVKNKLAAIRLFETTDLFYHDARAFESIVLAVNDRMVRPGVFELVSPEDLVYALLVLHAKPDQFEREIYAYIKACMEHAGVIKYPPTLAFAQPKYTGFLAVLAEQVDPKLVPDNYDETNPVHVQSAKLRHIIEAANNKIAGAKIDTIEPAAV